MQVANLTELKKLLKLCRKEGVTEISLGEVSFKLGDKPQPNVVNQAQDQTDEIPFEGALSDEELAFWSASPTQSDS